MSSYPVFLAIATATVLSPGPGVVLTLTNGVRYGVSGALAGILGIACGAFIVAGVSATGLGILLATSSLAFSIMKCVGAAYLAYLGIKLWRAPARQLAAGEGAPKSPRRQFLEGFALQLTNPKAVCFFLSVFPHFVDPAGDFVRQFLVLVATYSGLVVVIHLGYARLAKTARPWLASDRGGRIFNRIGGGTFVCFGAGLAAASR